MNYTTKIKAFTLSEMLVVLLITTIVIGMAFSVQQLVQQQLLGIASNYESNTAFNRLQQSLWTDFHQHDGVWYNASSQELVFENTINTAVYQLHDSYIVKEQDTFRVALAKQEFFFVGKPQASGEIDALEWATSRTAGSQRLFAFKKNAATSFINQ